jgi:hypothetical protein
VRRITLNLTISEYVSAALPMVSHQTVAVAVGRIFSRMLISEIGTIVMTSVTTVPAKLVV